MRETKRPTTPGKHEVVEIAQIVCGSIWRLKSWRPEPGEGQQPVVVAGQELPSGVGMMVAGSVRVLCIGPGEWLIVAAATLGQGTLKIIEPGLLGQGVSLVDMTDGLTGFSIWGPRARELLSTGSGLDFHPGRLSAGSCARTRLAQIPAVIECLDKPPRYEIYVTRSHGDYLGAWLRDAAAEWMEVS